MDGAIDLNTFLSSLFCEQKKASNGMLAAHRTTRLLILSLHSLQQESHLVGWFHRTVHLPIFLLLWTEEGWQLYAGSTSYALLILSLQLTTAARITLVGRCH